MQVRVRACVLVVLALVGCTGGDDGPATPVRDDAAAKVRAAIEDPTGLEPVPTEPLPGEGRLLCVDGEEIRLYLYDSAGERADAAALIDPADPSHVGTAIVAWSGNPAFWEVDRAIVLYLGTDEALRDELVAGLGEPYAAGRGRTGAGGAC